MRTDRTNKPKSTLKKRVVRYLPIYLMALPAIIYLIINNYIPMAGLVVAFKNYRYDKGIFGSDWCGLKNFEFLFKTQDAMIITRNTLLYNLAFILLGTVCSIAVAILLNEVKSKIFKKAYQTVVLLPYLLSMVIVAYVVYSFLSPDLGLLNQILKHFGLDTVSWYSEPKYWPFILVLVNLWCNTGYNCIVYLATIVGIDQGYYEVASIDGATSWQKIRHITLPFLKPIIITMTLLAVGKIFYSDFGLFYQVPMNVGSLYDVTNTIDTYVYRGLLQTPNIGMSGAAGAYQSIVGLLFVLTANFAVKKISKENALF